jgi:hypothetical protein
MENASKALIIAGAILLSILIISLGIMIFNQASGVVNNSSMDEVEIASFNQKFMQYEGTNVKGAQVNALLNQVIQNNIATQDDKSKEVAVAGEALVASTNWTGTVPNGGKPTKSTDVGKAQTGKTYTVTSEVDTKTGLINKVKIKANS